MALLFPVVTKATRHVPYRSIPHKPQKKEVVKEFLFF
jgi:hypothetical protein